jgi:hypothetical protein
MRLVIALVVWVAAIAAAAELSSVVAKSAGKDAAAASFDASAVKATDARSLFVAANLDKALSTVSRHFGAGARIDRLVVYPGYLDTTVVTPSGETDVYVNAAGKYEPTSTPATPGTDPLIPLSRIKPGDPAALAQRIATGAHVPTSALHYMIADTDPVTHRFEWLIYTVPGTGVDYFHAAGPTGRLLEYRTNSTVGLQPVGG